MFVLGIEAATPVAAVAVVQDSKLLAESFVNNQRTHSINLLPMIKQVIEAAGLMPADLDGVAVSAGPGSFTGLRIGMTTAKTLAQVWSIPVVGVSTLDALAYPLANYRQLICPILNARRNEVYAAVYQDGEKISGPVAVSPDDLVRELSRRGREVFFVGDGVPVYREKLTLLMGAQAHFAPASLLLPRGAAVAELGLERLRQGQGVDPLILLPQYLRQSEAEIKLACAKQQG